MDSAAQQPDANTHTTAPQELTWGTRSRVFRFAELPVRHNPNGSESRDVGHGALVTGEHVAVHESMQVPGTPPNPAHRIDHTELICLSSGTAEFTHDGTPEPVKAGDVILVAKGTLHSLRNTGDGPARYFVVALGGDTQ